MWAAFLSVILLGGACVLIPQIRAYCKGEIPKDMFSKRFAVDRGPSAAPPAAASAEPKARSAAHSPPAHPPTLLGALSWPSARMAHSVLTCRSGSC
jgi:hypothetical protein